MRSEVYNSDCLEAMRQMEDNAFNLAIVDPPYGIGISSNPARQMHEVKSWDAAIPQQDYFDELMRVSVNQIVWGGNYFPLPPTQNLIVWNKLQPFNFSLAMCEFAWCSIQRPAKMYTQSPIGIGKIHPTQKPPELYRWLLTHYAKQGDTILDTHLGSGSSRIAAYDLGFDFVGYELDTDYFNAQEKRFADHIAQPKLFSVATSPNVTTAAHPTLFAEATA
jgi:site-specific DNA-methyltransferase (adenine-specific)